MVSTINGLEPKSVLLSLKKLKQIQDQPIALRLNNPSLYATGLLERISFHAEKLQWVFFRVFSLYYELHCRYVATSEQYYYLDTFGHIQII